MKKLKAAIKARNLVFILFACCAFKAALPPPPDMWANTGAPGEVTCVSCHNQYPINSGGGYIKLSAAPPITGGHYVAGQLYMITANITQPASTNYQCSIEIVDSLGSNAGTMAVTDSIYSLLETAQTGRICLWGGQSGVDTIFHCSFMWTAPLSGEVSMYTAGVVHGDLIGGATGHVYSDSLLHLKPGGVSGVAELPGGDKVSVFPNPVHNYLHLRYKGEPGLLHFEIINTNGELVKRGYARAGVINVNDLPAGVFYIQYNGGFGKQGSVQFLKE